jgi:hypothetical protein
MKSTVSWDITPCSPLNVNRRFGGTYRSRSSGSKNKPSNKPAWKQVASRAWKWRRFLRNVGWHSTDYTALYPRRLLFNLLRCLLTQFTFFHCCFMRPQAQWRQSDTHRKRRQRWLCLTPEMSTELHAIFPSLCFVIVSNNTCCLALFFL